jgi:subtilisin family serine protease
MSRPKLVLALIALAVFAVHLSSGPPVGSTPGGHGPFVPGEIIVKFKAGAHGPDKTAVQAALDAYTVKTFHSTAEHWSLGSGVDVLDAVQQLSANPLVEYAEPNYILTADVIPDDEHFDELWNMYNVGQTGGTTDADIDAEMAWGVSTGSANVLVGVIDTGVDYTHPDLAANIWTNPGEIPDKTTTTIRSTTTGMGLTSPAPSEPSGTTASAWQVSTGPCASWASSSSAPVARVRRPAPSRRSITPR